MPRGRPARRATSAPTWAWATTAACCSGTSTRSRARPASPSGPTLLPDPTPEQIDASIAAGDTPYGTPDEVEVAIRKYADAGVDQVVFGLLSSTMERDLAFETIETFGKHVLPAFDTDPVHRTTRQREAAAAASAR